MKKSVILSTNENVLVNTVSEQMQKQQNTIRNLN